MGKTKARLALDGVTLLRRACDLLRPVTRRLAILGDDGHRRDSPDVEWLADVPEVHGPMAGILAAFDFDSAADWLIVGCDMPAFDRRAVDWLIKNHDGRRDATVGLLPGRSEPEPLLAVYASRSAGKLGALAAARKFGMRRALATLNARIVAVPQSLAAQWRNVNTPAEYSAFQAELRSGG
jgi:molybdopterin-guanine dinucleotide biosynthesis protein A